MNNLDHKHLLISATVDNPPKKVSELNAWLKHLCNLIDMEIITGPHSVYLSEKGNRGVTGIVGISTSHIAVHFWDEEEPAKVQLDVYSCKQFDIINVIDHLRQFGLQKIKYKEIDRNF